MKEIRVAIFEDNKLLRDALNAIIDGTNGYTCCGIFTDGNSGGFIFSVIAFDDANAGTAQAALLVMITFTWLPLVNVFEE